MCPGKRRSEVPVSIYGEIKISLVWTQLVFDAHGSHLANLEEKDRGLFLVVEKGPKHGCLWR